MNVRSRLSGKGPVLAGAVTLLALAAPLPALEGVALAQQPQPADSVTVIARQRYNEGVKAFDAGKYEDARAAFLQAYALKHHPAVLLNLGQSELRSGHYDDAGNHLQEFLREFPSASPDEKDTAGKGVAEAKKKASFVIVSVDAAGADLSVDGNTIGRSPLYDPVFVRPGKHTIFATLGGRSAAASIDAKVGLASTAQLTLGVPGVAPAPQPVAPVAPPPVAPVAPPQQQVYPQPQPLPPPQWQGPQAGPLPPMMPPAQEQPGQEHESFGHWYTHKPVAWVGTGLAGLGLIMGIAGGGAAGAASHAANNVGDQIRAEQAKQAAKNISEPTAVCGDKSGNGALAHYASACAQLRSNIGTYHTDIGVTATGWVFFGVGVVGTAMYALIDWFPHRPTDGHASSGLPRVSVAPVVAPTFKGVGLTGDF